MSADLLREAAREIRHDTFNGQTEDAQFMEAVADWLEADATVIERHNLDVTVSKAYDVACAYLGVQA